MKLVTFVPLVIILYYTDFGSWRLEFITGGLIYFFVAGLTLFGYGIFLKRKIISAYLENSETSFAIGFPTLLLSISLFIVGAVVFYRPFFQFESLLTLLLSYLLLRFDKRLVRILLPLFFIVALSFSLPLVNVLIGTEASVAFVALVMIAAFSVFTDIERRTLLLPLIVTLLELTLWYFSFNSLLTGLYFSLIIPAAAFMILVAGNRGRQLELRPGATSRDCPHEQELRSKEGFCQVCGKKVSHRYISFSTDFFALAVIILILFSLVLIEVPVLGFSSGTPVIYSYSYSGITISPYLSPPPGWLVNGTDLVSLVGSVYATETVYVPIFHPETSNYTLISAIGVPPIILGTQASGVVPGWNTLSRDPTNIQQFIGYLTVYQSSSNLMINYEGVTNYVTFLESGTFTIYSVSMSLTRIFQGVTVTNATAEFESDLTKVFVPLWNSEAFSNSWTDFLHKADESTNVLGPIIATVATTGVLSGVIYEITESDEETDRKITRASGLAKNEWMLFARASLVRKEARTLEEISGNEDYEKPGGHEEHFKSLLESLEWLRFEGLVRHVVIERGADPLLAWEFLE